MSTLTPFNSAVPTKPLKYVAALRGEKVDSVPTEGEYLGLEQIESGTGLLSDVELQQQPEGAANVFGPGDVLFGKLRPYLAKGWTADRAGYCTTEALVLQPQSADSRFVRYCVLASEFIEAVNGSTYGTKMPRADWSFVGSVQIPCPNMVDQERIANFLDEQTARIDALIAEKERLDGRLQEYRLSLISAAVTGQIDGKNTDKAGVTQSWPTKRLRYVAELNPAVRSDLVAAQDTEVTFLPMDAIGEDGSLNLERVRPVAEVRNGYSYFEDGDVAFAKVTPCFENGKGALMRNLQFGAGFGTTELTVLRPKVGTCASFLRYVLQSENFRRNGAGAMTGAGGLKRVPDDFTRDFETPWPPHSEQERIAAFLDEQTNSIDALRHHVREHIERLREYRSSLISAAVTGQLDLSTFKEAA